MNEFQDKQIYFQQDRMVAGGKEKINRKKTLSYRYIELDQRKMYRGGSFL